MHNMILIVQEPLIFSNPKGMCQYVCGLSLEACEPTPAADFESKTKKKALHDDCVRVDEGRKMGVSQASAEHPQRQLPQEAPADRQVDNRSYTSRCQSPT